MHGDRLSLTDLELLHTFTTSTYATLSENALIRDAWRLSLMPMCLSTEFLMRTVPVVEEELGKGGWRKSQAVLWRMQFLQAGFVSSHCGGS